MSPLASAAAFQSLPADGHRQNRPDHEATLQNAVLITTPTVWVATPGRDSVGVDHPAWFHPYFRVSASAAWRDLWDATRIEFLGRTPLKDGTNRGRAHTVIESAYRIGQSSPGPPDLDARGLR